MNESASSPPRLYVSVSSMSAGVAATGDPTPLPWPAFSGTLRVALAPSVKAGRRSAAVTGSVTCSGSERP